jgi:hypothetical protein
MVSFLSQIKGYSESDLVTHHGMDGPLVLEFRQAVVRVWGSVQTEYEEIFKTVLRLTWGKSLSTARSGSLVSNSAGLLCTRTSHNHPAGWLPLKGLTSGPDVASVFRRQASVPQHAVCSMRYGSFDGGVALR